MISLHKFLPQISGFLSTTPAALYERQRQLVRLGILTAEKGRGPGSGVELSAESLAALLVALLATDNLSDTDGRILLLLSSKPVDKVKFAKTGGATFWEALAALLLSPQKVKDLAFIMVDRNMLLANIMFTRGKKTSGTLFATDLPRNVVLPGIAVSATIDKSNLLPVSLALTDALKIKEE
jgi:hypothetical protein